MSQQKQNSNASNSSKSKSNESTTKSVSSDVIKESFQKAYQAKKENQQSQETTEQETTEQETAEKVAEGASEEQQINLPQKKEQAKRKAMEFIKKIFSSNYLVESYCNAKNLSKNERELRRTNLDFYQEQVRVLVSNSIDRIDNEEDLSIENLVNILTKELVSFAKTKNAKTFSFFLNKAMEEFLVEFEKTKNESIEEVTEEVINNQRKSVESLVYSSLKKIEEGKSEEEGGGNQAEQQDIQQEGRKIEARDESKKKEEKKFFSLKDDEWYGRVFENPETGISIMIFGFNPRDNKYQILIVPPTRKIEKILENDEIIQKNKREISLAGLKKLLEKGNFQEINLSNKDEEEMRQRRYSFGEGVKYKDKRGRTIAIVSYQVGDRIFDEETGMRSFHTRKEGTVGVLIPKVILKNILEKLESSDYLVEKEDERRSNNLVYLKTSVLDEFGKIIQEMGFSPIEIKKQQLAGVVGEQQSKEQQKEQQVEEQQVEEKPQEQLQQMTKDQFPEEGKQEKTERKISEEEISEEEKEEKIVEKDSLRREELIDLERKEFLEKILAEVLKISNNFYESIKSKLDNIRKSPRDFGYLEEEIPTISQMAQITMRRFVDFDLLLILKDDLKITEKKEQDFILARVKSSIKIYF